MQIVFEVVRLIPVEVPVSSLNEHLCCIQRYLYPRGPNGKEKCAGSFGDEGSSTSTGLLSVTQVKEELKVYFSVVNGKYQEQQIP